MGSVRLRELLESGRLSIGRVIAATSVLPASAQLDRVAPAGSTSGTEVQVHRGLVTAGSSSSTDAHISSPPVPEPPDVYLLGGGGSLLTSHPSKVRSKRGRRRRGGGRMLIYE